MKRTGFPLISLCIITLCWLNLGQAATVEFAVNPDGIQAAAGQGTGSAATGTGTVTLDTVTRVLEWDIDFDAGALTNGPDSVTVAHFHTGAVGISGPPIDPPGNIAGAGTSPLTGSATVSEQSLQSFMAGTMYVNIHTTAFPAGEIRGQVVPDKVMVGAVLDNTLYENNNGSLSNGAGQHLFAGRDNNGRAKRALIQFGLSDAALPEGAIITGASVTLNMSKTGSGSSPVTLHRVLQAWGEGASNASGQEGGGTSARPGDATWLHRRFNTDFWDTPGGDFNAQASATLQVGGNRKYTWESAQMASDVQGWLDNPGTHFGWLFKGRETTKSAKRFDSREHPNQNNRPVLEIAYTPPCPYHLTGDLNGDCKVDFKDFAIMTNHWLVDCTTLPLDEACLGE